MITESSFALEGAGGPSERAQARRATVSAYGQPLAGYAEKYGYSLRAIKRWISLGRSCEPVDLPPLDTAEEMAAWWERMRTAGLIKWKVPEVFSGPAPVREKKVAVVAAREAGAVAAASKATATDGLGFAAALRRAQEAERLAHGRWQAELVREGEDFDPQAEKRRAEAWDRAAKLLESMEVKSDKILGREYARMEDVEELVVERETSIRDGIRSIGTRVATKLNLPAELFGKVVEGFDAEVDRVFGHLQGGEGATFELLS